MCACASKHGWYFTATIGWLVLANIQSGNFLANILARPRIHILFIVKSPLYHIKYVRSWSYCSLFVGLSTHMLSGCHPQWSSCQYKNGSCGGGSTALDLCLKIGYLRFHMIIFFSYEIGHWDHVKLHFHTRPHVDHVKLPVFLFSVPLTARSSVRRRNWFDQELDALMRSGMP